MRPRHNSGENGQDQRGRWKPSRKEAVRGETPMLKILSFRSPRKRGPRGQTHQPFERLDPRFRGDDRLRSIAMLFGCALAALCASPANADTLRVGKAGREAFS